MNIHRERRRSVQSRGFGGPVVITPSTKGIQTGMLKNKRQQQKKPNNKLNFFLQPSVNLSLGRIWQTENERFGKITNAPRRLDHHTFCALCILVQLVSGSNKPHS